LRESMSHHRLRLVGVVCVALTILPAAGDNSARVDRLGREVICMCGCNQILLECNHLGCPYLTSMRQQLTTAVDGGESDSGILQGFVTKYGVTVLAAPTKAGFDRVAWIMPYVALLIGVGSVVLVVRNWRGHPAPVPATGNAAKAAPDLDRFREQARKETEL
jgi:cytochrome c-type biogenesis protein CcmH/NrfF